jgi:hypothetical protein
MAKVTRYKLGLFDQATARQRKREAATSVKKQQARPEGRGWTREKLYERGLSR